MADTTDNTDELAALQSLIAAGGATGANSIQQQAYQAMLQNLQDRFGDYKNLGPAGYNPITAQKLAPSALDAIPNDAQSRESQQAAIAQLDNIAKSGGMTLADKNALNQTEGTLNQNNSAREAQLANTYAARGQLGSGAQLAMDLAHEQNATTNANAAGESAAADAQKRAMQAVLQKAEAARTMGNDDYNRKKAAAEATDSIAAHNANFATDASKYNNTLVGQNRADELAKLAAESNLTSGLNTTLMGKANSSSNYVNGLTGLGTGLLGKLGTPSNPGKNGGSSGGSGSSSSNGDTPTDPNNPGNDNTNLQPDPNDPQPGQQTDSTDTSGTTGFEDDLVDGGGSYA